MHVAQNLRRSLGNRIEAFVVTMQASVAERLPGVSTTAQADGAAASPPATTPGFEAFFAALSRAGAALVPAADGSAPAAGTAATDRLAAVIASAADGRIGSPPPPNASAQTAQSRSGLTDRFMDASATPLLATPRSQPGDERTRAGRLIAWPSAPSLSATPLSATIQVADTQGSPIAPRCDGVAALLADIAIAAPVALIQTAGLNTGAAIGALATSADIARAGPPGAGEAEDGLNAVSEGHARQKLRASGLNGQSEAFDGTTPHGPDWRNDADLSASTPVPASAFNPGVAAMPAQALPLPSGPIAAAAGRAFSGSGTTADPAVAQAIQSDAGSAGVRAGPAARLLREGDDRVDEAPGDRVTPDKVLTAATASGAVGPAEMHGGTTVVATHGAALPDAVAARGHAMPMPSSPHQASDPTDPPEQSADRVAAGKGAAEPAGWKSASERLRVTGAGESSRAPDDATLGAEPRSRAGDTAQQPGTPARRPSASSPPRAEAGESEGIRPRNEGTRFTPSPAIQSGLADERSGVAPTAHDVGGLITGMGQVTAPGPALAGTPAPTPVLVSDVGAVMHAASATAHAADFDRFASKDPVAGAATARTEAYDSPVTQAAPVLLSLARQGGSGTLSLHLKPNELGELHVRIGRDAAGDATVSITVERPETLALLIRDQAVLHRALDQAGMPSQKGSLSFHLAPPDSSAVATAPPSGDDQRSAGQNAPHRQSTGGDSSGADGSGQSRRESFRGERAPQAALEARGTGLTPGAINERAAVDITA